MAKIKKIKEPHKFLLDNGLLFMINHQLLHPFGLALAIKLGDDGKESEMSIDGIWDYRDDPEGLTFDDETFVVGYDKFQEFMTTFGEAKIQERYDTLGYIQQPHPDEIEEEPKVVKKKRAPKKTK